MEEREECGREREREEGEIGRVRQRGREREIRRCAEERASKRRERETDRDTLARTGRRHRLRRGEMCEAAILGRTACEFGIMRQLEGVNWMRVCNNDGIRER